MVPRAFDRAMQAHDGSAIGNKKIVFGFGLTSQVQRCSASGRCPSRTQTTMSMSHGAKQRKRAEGSLLTSLRMLRTSGGCALGGYGGPRIEGRPKRGAAR